MSDMEVQRRKSCAALWTQWRMSEQKVISLNPVTGRQTLSRSSQVRRRDPGKGNEEDMLSSPSYYQALPFLVSLYKNSLPWSKTQKPPAAPEELLRGQPDKITLEPGSSQACVFECMCLMCDPCSSLAIPAAIPAEENGAAPGSDSAATDIHQRDLLHICFAKSDWTIRVCSDIFKVSQKLPEKPISFLVLEVCYYKTWSLVWTGPNSLKDGSAPQSRSLRSCNHIQLL